MELRIDVYHHIEPGSADLKLDQLIAQQLALTVSVDALKEQGMTDTSKVMVELDRLNTVTNDMAASIDKVVAEDKAEDDAFRAEIESLKAQLAAGDAVTQAQLDSLASSLGDRNSKLESLSASLKAMGSDPDEPIPTAA